MMNRRLEFFAERAGMVIGDPGDQHRLFLLQKFGRDFDHLFRRLAGAKNDFGEIFAERAVHVHLGEPQIGHRCGLEGVQDFLLRNFPRAKLFQQLRGFGHCHGGTMPHGSPAVTRESGAVKLWRRGGGRPSQTSRDGRKRTGTPDGDVR